MGAISRGDLGATWESRGNGQNPREWVWERFDAGTSAGPGRAATLLAPPGPGGLVSVAVPGGKLKVVPSPRSEGVPLEATKNCFFK